ncbi:hypothetical protein V6N13_094389 [Hibiscus sabdariffa]|uniref:Uncharacterized protein n=1 Tax=Hibiscus sabdariffa TaxID=183260 RepID=A0ABR2PQE3_9ROSI
MYGRPTLQRTSSEFLSDLLSSPDVMSPPLNFLLSPVSQLAVANSVLHSGSGNLNSPTSVASFIRSVSSHSLHSSLYDFNDSDSGPVRRVFSTGDLHQTRWPSNFDDGMLGK